MAEMGKRGATIVLDAKIRSAPPSVDHVPNLMRKIIRIPSPPFLPLFALSWTNRTNRPGHEMGPGFAKHVASLEGAAVQSLEQLVDFNRKHPELSYAKGKTLLCCLPSTLPLSAYSLSIRKCSLRIPRVGTPSASLRTRISCSALGSKEDSN